MVYVYVPAAYKDGTKAPVLVIHDGPGQLNLVRNALDNAAALSMGWFRPDLFRSIVAYSGTFVAQQDEDGPEAKKYPFGAWEYHSGMKLIETSEKKPPYWLSPGFTLERTRRAGLVKHACFRLPLWEFTLTAVVRPRRQ